MINLFTVKQGCEECQEVYNELTGAAYSYLHHEAELNVPVFFGVIFYILLSEVWLTVVLITCLGTLSIKMILKSR